MRSSQIIDISPVWDEAAGSPTPYPGDAPFLRSALQDGGVRVSRLAFGVHCGAHLDFPAHYVPGGKAQDAYAAADFIMPALVVEAPGERVTVGDVEGSGLAPGEAILFRTRNSRLGLLGRRAVEPDFAWIEPEAASACVRRGARLAGIDYLSVDPFDDPGESGVSDAPAHRILLGAGVLILENADLRRVAPGRYTLIALPLPVKELEGSPVRAVLVR